MQQDFDGEMHDVPEDQRGDDDEAQSDEEKDELDKQMGDLGDQKEVVDEKL